ncbi:MAG: hypothetical protein RL703_1011 [Pseudomonadota bacterium]
MTGDEAHIITEREELFTNRTNELLVIPFGEIRASDGLLEQHIADHRQTGWRMVKADVAGGMPGAMKHIQCFTAHRDGIAIM